MARDIRLDSIKGFLIILVVLGHVIISLDNNAINHAVMGLIYLFHMPLFILISGYFTKHPDNQDARSMWQGVFKIFITLVIFQVIYSLKAQLLFGGSTFFDTIQKFPFGILWYLFSLICWRIILYYTPRWLLNRPLVYLGIALVLSLLSGLTHLGSFLSIQRTLNFLLFFLLGFYYRQGQLNSRLWNMNILHAAIVVVLSPLVFWFYPHCGNVMNGADYYGVMGLPEKSLVLLCSIAMSLLVFNMLPANRHLSAIGKDSLFYYVYHMLLVAGTLPLLADALNLPQSCRSLPFLLLYTAAVLAIVWLMSKIKFFWWLLNPSFTRRKPTLQ